MTILIGKGNWWLPQWLDRIIPGGETKTPADDSGLADSTGADAE